MAKRYLVKDNKIQNPVIPRYETKVLYENPGAFNSSVVFSPQTINLSSNDYKYLLMIFTRNNDDVLLSIGYKGRGGRICYSDYFSSATRSWNRKYSVSANGDQITFENAAMNGTDNNGVLKPYQIIGIK